LIRNSLRNDNTLRNLCLICIVLAGIVLAVYWHVINHQFLSYDDNVYVVNNPHVSSGITCKNIVWAFTSYYAANWHPITWLSHMADVQLYGMDPRGHHVTNVVIHALSSVILLLFLFRSTGSLWRSSFVAALFALHPLHVESVAWVAERKDVLCAFFGFFSLLLYSEYVTRRKPALYFLSLLSFIFGLLSKPMLVTLPVIMLLMDYWPLDRYSHEVQGQGMKHFSAKALLLIKDKLIFIFCSIMSAAITIYVQGTSGAIRSFDVIPFGNRVENALIAYVKYIGKTLWPLDLAVLYPMPLNLPLWEVLTSLAILLIVSSAIILSGRRHHYLVVGWLWFLVTLLPVIGFIQVGTQSMADRYSYIPIIGFFIMVTWGISDLLGDFKYGKGFLALLAGVILISLTALTRRQLSYWQDNISLYSHTLQVTTDNDKITTNLGVAFAEKGELRAAIREFQEALRINPNNKQARNNLGIALQNIRAQDEAFK